MRSSVLILFLISIIMTRLSAQNWQCIHDNSIYYYESQSHTMWAVKIDSVGWVNGDKTYYGFHSVRLVSDSVSGPANFYCADPEGASQISHALSVRESGNCFQNYRGDLITFRTGEELNSSWPCCIINDSVSLFATIISAGMETILGVADSVKSISFQARKTAGDPVNCSLNNKVFKLSKNFGMLTLFDFYRFPEYDSINSPLHELAGYAYNGSTTGEQNLTAREIYSFSPGDEFHIFYEYLDGPHGHGSQDRTIKIILDSAWNNTGDTVSYTVRLLKDNWLGMPGDPHEYSCDTLIESYPVSGSDCTSLDYQPGEAVICQSPQNGEETATWYTQYRSSDYNYLWVKENRYRYSACSFCADTLVGYSGGFFAENQKNLFIQGCGSGYFVKWWTDWYHDTYTTSRLLKYFRKGDESWGTPFDTTGWNMPASSPEPDVVDCRFVISPNPARDQFRIISQEPFTEIQIRLFDLSGKKLAELMYTQPEQVINLTSCCKGVYIVEITGKAGKKNYSKLMIE